MYIRTRLTLWFLLILTLLLVVFSIIIYQLTHNNSVAWVDQDVRHQASLLQARIHLCPNTQTLCVPPLDTFGSPDLYLQVRDPQGKVLASSGNLEQHVLPILRDPVAKEQMKELAVDGLTLVVYCQQVIINHRFLGYAIVARSPATIYFALGQLKNLLVPGVLVALGLVGLVIWLLVRQATRPLERLARTTAEIAATKDHSRRLIERKRNDEIGRLTLTINGMLHALEEAYIEVQKVNDLQSHFLIDVSHELRTPLTVML